MFFSLLGRWVLIYNMIFTLDKAFIGFLVRNVFAFEFVFKVASCPIHILINMYVTSRILIWQLSKKVFNHQHIANGSIVFHLRNNCIVLFRENVIIFEVDNVKAFLWFLIEQTTLWPSRSENAIVEILNLEKWVLWWWFECFLV